jgi:AcrR family transcriptional regulator
VQEVERRGVALVATVGDSLTPVQRQRRRRIIDASLALAAEGGYDAVQMREVAARADVALGTLYRYFSSKEHLLVAAMAEQVDGLRQRLAERPAAGEDDAERVMDVIHRATRALQRQPNVTIAMLKSLISSGEDVATTMKPIGELMTEIIISAMRHDPPDPKDPVVADVLQHVWMGSLLWWAAGRTSTKQVEDRVNRAAALLLRGT